MTPAMRVRKAERASSSGVGTAVPVSTGLPQDMIEESSKRLGIAALIYAVTFSLAYYGSAFPVWIRLGTVGENLLAMQSMVAMISIVASLVIFALSLNVKVCPEVHLNLGLVYLVVGSFGISVTEFWGVFPEWSPQLLESIRFFGIPWECVWIIIFPIVAPNRPTRTLIASLAAASTGLVVTFLSKSYGGTSPDAPYMFFVRYFLFSTYLCAFLAYFVSTGIQKLGRNIREAREIGSYRLVKPLGRGGMGEVWRARHRMLARPAAIKLIRPEVLGSDETMRKTLLRRFEREAQATASLESYHTIDVYDFGVTDNGSFYYVMELLDGMDLDSLVKRFGPISAERAIHFTRQVCHSLMDAHENGMVHRDIKPGNVFVCRLGPDHDFIKVLDFGLVKSYSDPREGDTQLTVQGLAPGTPGFMAPEMAMGKGNVDGRSDIYALGCVAYWLVTGELVFEGDTPLAAVLHHVQTDPIPPSQRTEMEIPESLERVILSCLEKDPAKRPQSARELDARLTQCETMRAWTREMAEEWWTLHLPRTKTVDENGDESEAESVTPAER